MTSTTLPTTTILFHAIMIYLSGNGRNLVLKIQVFFIWVWKHLQNIFLKSDSFLKRYHNDRPNAHSTFLVKKIPFTLSIDITLISIDISSKSFNISFSEWQFFFISSSCHLRGNYFRVRFHARLNSLCLIN